MALLGTASAWAAPVIPTPFPEGLAGNYQALLYSQDGDAGSPVGLVTLAVTTKGALTGKLTTLENKTYPLKATLSYADTESLVANAPAGTATAPTIQIVRGKNIPNLSVNLTIKDFEENDTLDIFVNEEATTIGSTENGFKQITFAKGALPYAAAGAYTAAFELADTPGQNDPAGSGYAVGSIDAKGLLKLTGKTGDGTVFTAALPAGPDYRYVTFLNPYKRNDSFFAGKIILTERNSGGFHMTPAEAGYDFQWKKSSLLPKITDKSYRAGFGPLDVLVSMEPWTVPAKGETVADLFGISALEIFNIGYDGVFPGTAYTKYIPVKAGLTAQNTLRIAAGGAGSTSGFDPSLWAKIITTKIDPKTGKFTATVNIEDTIEPTTPTGKSKTVKRKVAFEGVLLRPDSGSLASIAQGQIILPPKDVKTETTTSSMFAFSGNIVEDAIYAAAAPTAGTYKGVIIRQPNEPEDSQDAIIPYATGTPGPPAGANITFTISPDLQTLNFQGRLLKLRNDGRGTNNIITYDDLPGNITNSCLVHLQLDGTTKQVVGIFATYNQFGRSGFSVITRISNFLQRDNSIIKQ